MADEALQPLQVHGYSAQPRSAVDIVNANKVIEEKILRVMDELSLAGECDARWLAIARTDMEKAFMALNRAVFKPKRLTDLG